MDRVANAAAIVTRPTVSASTLRRRSDRTTVREVIGQSLPAVRAVRLAHCDPGHRRVRRSGHVGLIGALFQPCNDGSWSGLKALDDHRPSIPKDGSEAVVHTTMTGVRRPVVRLCS